MTRPRDSEIRISDFGGECVAAVTGDRSERLVEHVSALASCARCPRMQRPAVVGRPVPSRVILVGQAPGAKEPVHGRPFAWTAGRTLFAWFERGLGWTEDESRSRLYFAAACRCFPGKLPGGGDRVPTGDELRNCRPWLDAEITILEPELILPVGKLAIGLFLDVAPLTDQIGRQFRVAAPHGTVDVIPLPHPSGASPWHRTEPGKSLLVRALQRIAAHPAIRPCRE